MTTTRRVRIKGVRKKQIDADTLAFVYFQLAKARVEEKRRREAAERAKRQGAAS
jgi:hypothetical protein